MINGLLLGLGVLALPLTQHDKLGADSALGFPFILCRLYSGSFKTRCAQTVKAFSPAPSLHFDEKSTKPHKGALIYHCRATQSCALFSLPHPNCVTLFIFLRHFEQPAVLIRSSK